MTLKRKYGSMTTGTGSWRGSGVGPVARGLIWALLALAAVWPGAATAHAIIQMATPAVNATVPGPDVDVVLRYNSRLDLQRSRLSVTLPDGTLKPLPLIANPADPAALAARLQGLTAGAYVLHWQVLAVDGHMTRGNVPFSVGQR
ncbi:MAG: copper resistance CopC family protein [Rhodospirillaceae bacterium]